MHHLARRDTGPCGGYRCSLCTRTARRRAWKPRLVCAVELTFALKFLPGLILGMGNSGPTASDFAAGARLPQVNRVIGY